MKALQVWIRVVMLGLVVSWVPVAEASPYWGSTEAEAWQAGRTTAQETHPWADLPHAVGDARDDLAMFGLAAEFLSIWQVDIPGDPEFGGMREGEHLPDIIQTDNTSESIWVWTRYYELTGDNQYHQNVLDAWTYCMNYPAYLEEGGSTEYNGYYRMYNCGWAVRAAQKYLDIYGDDTYQAYADSCASYLRYHTLSRPGSGFYRYVNPPVLSWAMGNLYYVGMRQNNAEWRAEAVRQAEEKIKVWIEDEPALLANETWAMSGGATMWGLLESYFCAHPAEIDTWVPLYKDYMDVFSSAGDFQNAWNGWYALGHWATGVALEDAYHIGVHSDLTDYLIAQDGDLDGGIPARPEDTDDMDQTWVTNYLVYMGLDERLPPAADVPVAGPAIETRIALLAGPNPAHGRADVRFQLARPQQVWLEVFDAAGRKVTDLAAGQLPAGRHQVSWQGEDSAGRRVPAGVYALRLHTAEGASAMRSFVWVR